MSALPGAGFVAQASNDVTAAQGSIKTYLPLVQNFTPPPSTLLVVNSTDDVTDAKAGDGKCETVIGNGVCTLRAAIREANALDGSDTISVPAGTFTLTLSGLQSTGGDLDVSSSGGDLTIVGAGANATVIAAASNLNERVFDISSGINVSIFGLTVRDGRAINVPGGGIYNKGVLTLSHVEIRDNSAVRTSLELSGDGGGIRNTGTLTIFNSTIANNSSFDDGGGILNNGRMTLVNVTVSNNRAVGEQGAISDGGGITNQYSSSVPTGAIADIINSTIANNSASNTGGGLKNGSTASMTIRNTIIAYNSDGTASGNRNCSGPITSAGGNVENGTTCKLTGPNDKPSTDPLLGGLQNNGGTTSTRALLPGSPAINGGVNEGCPATDQRGLPRPVGGACDSGAFEAQ